MYGTRVCIDRNTGQLYTIGDIDVTPIDLFGGIPDEDLNEQTIGSTFVPAKSSQAMSIPVTDMPGGPKTTTGLQDSVPLPTPSMPTIQQEEETWTSSSTLSDPSMLTPPFNVN